MSCFQKYLGGGSIESGWSFLHNNILSFIYAYIPFVHLSAFTVSLPPFLHKFYFDGVAD